MEKDLRDAYAALKLLRADLVKTRRDKRALEASLMQFQTHGPPPSAAQTRESRETQQMQHEDANSQLWRLAALYESRLAEMEMQLLHNNCKKTEEAPEVEDNQQEDEDESEGLEKLALLNKLHSLTATVEQQTQTMLAQQATFALQKGELETALEDLQHKLQTEERKVADAVLEQQAAKENYEFLETQVEILKEEKRKLEENTGELEVKLATHAQTSSILKQQLEEKEEERRNLETEQAERELKHQQMMEKLISELQQDNEKKKEKLRGAHEREIAELQQKVELLELELRSEKEKKLQDQNNIQARYTATLQELETSCDELKAQLAETEAKRDAAMKETEKIADVQEQHAVVLDDMTTELEEAQADRKDKEMQLEEALETLKDQLTEREQHTVTLRDLEDKFTSVKNQLAAAEEKLVEEAQKHEELLAEASQKLRDQELNQERYIATLHKTKNKLATVEAQLADADAKRHSEVEEYVTKLKQVSERAAQHDQLSSALVMEKKALQQELYEAQQTSKLTTEEFQKSQLMMKQKTLDHFNNLNRARKQCETLETQLLSAEDNKMTCMDEPVDDSYKLKAFRGLSDTEITALPPSRSWNLLRSRINELEDFLPHLQIFVQALSEVLALCKNHSDTLPALCERLEGKTPYDNKELPVLTFALRLLRFVATLKAQIQQEDAPVTAKSVQVLRRRVLDALAQWYECDSNDSGLRGSETMPTPTFTITSRETALILQNWTNERTKQIGVRRWLARMEAYPGVPPLRGASSNRVLELPPEGCTLELEDMTPEVKDAFLLLLIPILKQNRALHVRVFTRYSDISSKDRDEEDQEKVWAMRIHVQSVVAQKSRPSPLKLSPSSHGLPSPLAPNSPASSVSSSTSSSASSRLQIIQERLQYLHNNA